MKHPEQEYLNAEPFLDECEVLYRKTKLVKTRKEHECYVKGVLFKDFDPEHHTIPVGEMAVMESAMVEGEWGKTYSCVKCLDIYLDHLHEQFD